MANESTVGFRVFTQIQRPPAEVLALFESVESTHVSDAMHRFYGMDLNIRPVSPEMRAVGPALTVRTRPGDNLMVFKALEIAAPGDILVIEHRGYTTVAAWGDLVSMVAQKVGVAGVVTDGGIRDRAGIIKVGVPVFAQDVQSPQGSLKDGPGEVNVPVACGGVPVLPGDVIVADVNGVVVVPRADAEAVGRKAIEIAAYEQNRIREIEAGDLIPASINKTLKDKGCLIK